MDAFHLSYENIFLSVLFIWEISYLFFLKRLEQFSESDGLLQVFLVPAVMKQLRSKCTKVLFSQLACAVLKVCIYCLIILAYLFFESLEHPLWCESASIVKVSDLRATKTQMNLNLWTLRDQSHVCRLFFSFYSCGAKSQELMEVKCLWQLENPISNRIILQVPITRCGFLCISSQLFQTTVWS